jgi:hypothetical protein
MAATKKNYETRMSNIEQGISNDEVELSLPFPSVFNIRYSACPLCPQADTRWDLNTYALRVTFK